MSFEDEIQSPVDIWNNVPWNNVPYIDTDNKTNKKWIHKNKVREALVKRRDNIIKRCKNEEIRFYQTVLLNDLLKELGLDDEKDYTKNPKLMKALKDNSREV
jgi:hypothetical protein